MSQTAVARAVSGVAVVVLTLAAAGCRADAPSPTAAPVTAPTAAPPTAAVVVKPPVATAIVAQATTAPTVTAPPTTASTLAAPPTAGPAAAQPTSPAGVQTGFVRPDVAPLPPAGRFQVISQTPWPGEKVRVFFLGAQFWPFCAAERWALVSALERFGTFQGLAPEAHVAGYGGFRLIPTYDMRNATYTSDFVQYSDREIRDKDFQPLEQLDADEQAIIDRYNKDARWPFVFINGQYAQVSSGFSPSVVDGLEFEALRQQLQSGAQTDATRAIQGEADIITRYICHSTGGQPAAACSR